MDLALLAERLDALIDEFLRPKRAAHSRAVADLAVRLGQLNGLDPLRCRVSGLAHDLCKDLPFERQKGLALIYEARSGTALPYPEEIGRAVLHGPAAAGFLESRFDLVDRDILEAVACHTIGTLDMGPLAKLVYAADKIEPGRNHVDSDFRQRCEALGIDELFALVVASTVDWMRSRDMPIAIETMDLYHSLSRQEPFP